MCGKLERKVSRRELRVLPSNRALRRGGGGGHRDPSLFRVKVYKQKFYCEFMNRFKKMIIKLSCKMFMLNYCRLVRVPTQVINFSLQTTKRRQLKVNFKWVGHSALPYNPTPTYVPGGETRQAANLQSTDYTLSPFAHTCRCHPETNFCAV